MKKKLSIFGIIIGIAFIIVGFISMSGGFGGITSYASGAPYSYDSGFASFGADYYTYSVNNAAEAAQGARIAAGNIGDVADFLLAFFGVSSILFGLMVICGFGIVLSTCPKKLAQGTTEEIAYDILCEVETPVEETIAQEAFVDAYVNTQEVLTEAGIIVEKTVTPVEESAE
ncbi:MAG: hypothetical protein IJ944_04095 [Clostridia bacterium]|nr:hypothetical protein [Clostridia bacterium]